MSLLDDDESPADIDEDLPELDDKSLVLDEGEEGDEGGEGDDDDEDDDETVEEYFFGEVAEVCNPFGELVGLLCPLVSRGYVSSNLLDFGEEVGEEVGEELDIDDML